MKRIISLICLITIWLTLFEGCQMTTPVASNSSNSTPSTVPSSSVVEQPFSASTVNLTDEEIAYLKNTDEDEILRIYTRDPFKLGEGKDLHEFLENCQQYFAVKTGGIIEYKCMHGDEKCWLCEKWIEPRIEPLYNYMLYPERVFGKYVKVYEVYCIDGIMSSHGEAIIYITNKGDYVLYRERQQSFSSEKRLFMMNLDVYIQLAQASIGYQGVGCGELEGREPYEVIQFPVELAVP